MGQVGSAKGVWNWHVVAGWILELEVVLLEAPLHFGWRINDFCNSTTTFFSGGYVVEWYDGAVRDKIS